MLRAGFVKQRFRIPRQTAEGLVHFRPFTGGHVPLACMTQIERKIVNAILELFDGILLLHFRLHVLSLLIVFSLRPSAVADGFQRFDDLPCRADAQEFIDKKRPCI